MPNLGLNAEQIAALIAYLATLEYYSLPSGVSRDVDSEFASARTVPLKAVMRSSSARNSSGDVIVVSKVTKPSARSCENVASRTPSTPSTATRAAAEQPSQVMPVTSSATVR